jgi:hypothetical protein
MMPICCSVDHGKTHSKVTYNRFAAANQMGYCGSLATLVKDKCGCSSIGRIGALQVSGKGSTPFARSKFYLIVRDFDLTRSYLEEHPKPGPQTSSPKSHSNCGEYV